MEQFELFTTEAETINNENALVKTLSGGKMKEFAAGWLTFLSYTQNAERIIFEGINYTYQNALELAKDNIGTLYQFSQLPVEVSYRDNRIHANFEGTEEVSLNENDFVEALKDIFSAFKKPISEMNFIEKTAYYRVKHQVQLGLSANDLDGSSSEIYVKHVDSMQWLLGNKADLTSPEKLKDSTINKLVSWLPQHPENEHFVKEAVFHKYLRYNVSNLVPFPVQIGNKVKLPGYGIVTVEDIKENKVILRGDKKYSTNRMHINEMEFDNKMYKIPFGCDKDELIKFGPKGLLEKRRTEYYDNLSEYEIIQSAVVGITKTKAKGGYPLLRQAVLEGNLSYVKDLLLAGKNETGTKETIFIQRGEQGYTISCGDKVINLSFEDVIQHYKEMLSNSKQDVMSLSIAEITLKYRELGYEFQYYPTARTFFVQHILGGDSYISHTHKRAFWDIEKTIARFNHKKIS